MCPPHALLPRALTSTVKFPPAPRGSPTQATTSHGGHGNYPVFDSPYTRGPYGGSLDGGSVGGSVDGDSVSGYSWTEPSSVVGASWPGGQPQSYTVVKAVGGGGAGEAYIVTGKADGKQYVAKQIVCLGDQYKAAPASYALQETRLLFLLQHPHICRLVDFYPRSANFIIIMEFCEQGDLGRHINGAIRRGNIKFDVERVYTWWYQILDAIEYCHSKAVLHRDLKPKNIFIDAKLNVKVGDFGVSALVSSPPALERVGTVTYHAPEVQNSLNYSVKSDVWAIGVIMWETMQLRPPGGEPVRLTMINFQDIAPTYGQACRDLLVMHLADHPEQRDNAGALKAAMLQLLQESTQQTIASRAYMSSASVQSEAAKYADLMRPRMIQVPHGMVDTSDGQPQLSHEPGDVRAGQPNWDRASESSTYSGRDGGSVTSNDRSQAGTTASHVQDLFSPTEETPEVMELSSDLGIHVTAGTGGEFGAWKIALLPEHKPAAKSNTIAVGEYLWEINGKVIFGMPFQLISSLVKGNAAEVKVGVKKGLGLSIRHAVIRFDGDYSKLENTETPENGASLGASNVTQLSGPGSPIASAQTEQVDESTPALTDTESPSELQADASSTVDSLPSVASESNLQKAGSVDSDAEKSPSAGRSILQVPAEVARRSPLVPQRALAPSSSPPTSEAVSEPEGTFGSDAPALRLEPKGIRAINSPIMQSPITNPRNPAAAHMPTDIGSELHSESSSSVDTLKEISASKASRTKVMTRGRTTIAGDGQYEGELCDGKPFGMGTATWPQQGHTYVGEWRDGVMHGHGTATYLNGDRYDGEWSNGKRSGLGRYAHGSGDIYEGLWSNERKHGLGVDSFADGRGYRGEFLENKFAGVGIYFTVDGAVYQVIERDVYYGCGGFIEATFRHSY
jgi:serine/threonine protein kinase